MADLLKQIDERIQETEDDMQELSLDGLKITKITPEIKARLEKINELIALSLNGCELESLDNLPNQPELVRLELNENKFNTAELTKVVERYPKLQILLLSDNNINDVNELKSLAKLEELMQIELNNTSVSKKDGYREKVFALIPSLEIVDDLDQEGNPFEIDEDEDGEDFGDDQEEGDDDYDEEDSEEEVKPKNTKKSKK
jgi:acidic leucine-rich nuclear phosphoprotein 32 family protein A/C/D